MALVKRLVFTALTFHIRIKLDYNAKPGWSNERFRLFAQLNDYLLFTPSKCKEITLKTKTKSKTKTKQ